MVKKAAIIRGDGTGPELVAAMLKVLKACNTQAELIECEAGSEQWEKHGGETYIPDETSKIMEESDACYKGPTTTIPRPDAPRSVAVSTRQKFELYSNVRPIKTYDRLSPDKKLDFVCFREATEGLYAGIEFYTSEDSAIAIRKTTRKGCQRTRWGPCQRTRQRSPSLQRRFWGRYQALPCPPRREIPGLAWSP